MNKYDDGGNEYEYEYDDVCIESNSELSETTVMNPSRNQSMVSSIIYFCKSKMYMYVYCKLLYLQLHNFLCGL